MSNSNQSAGQVWKSKEDQLEAEWRQSIVSGIGELREGQANLDERFSEMAIANQTQHGALGGELRELTARFERALEESNKKLESRSKVIQGTRRRHCLPFRVDGRGEDASGGIPEGAGWMNEDITKPDLVALAAKWQAILWLRDWEVNPRYAEPVRAGRRQGGQVCIQPSQPRQRRSRFLIRWTTIRPGSN